MKIYCSSCDKVGPVIIDNCHDAKTGEPFQDIVCEKCHLVIAAGTDIRREWVGLTDEEIDGLVANTRWHELIKATEAKLKEKNT